MEDDHSVVGFSSAAADAKDLLRRIQVAWLPEMRAKYPDLAQWNPTDPVTIPVHLKVFGSIENLNELFCNLFYLSGRI